MTDFYRRYKPESPEPDSIDERQLKQGRTRRRIEDIKEAARLEREMDADEWGAPEEDE